MVLNIFNNLILVKYIYKFFNDIAYLSLRFLLERRQKLRFLPMAILQPDLLRHLAALNLRQPDLLAFTRLR